MAQPHRPNSRAASRRAAYLTLVAPLAACALAGCGLWPSFPAALLDASAPEASPQDAPADQGTDAEAQETAPVADADDGAAPDAPLDGAATEASVDLDASPLDADPDAAHEAGVGDADPDAAATDDAMSSPDAMEAGTASGGFMTCGEPPAGPLSAEMVFAGVTDARDLAFDGLGRLVTGGRLLFSFDMAGMRTQLTPDDMPVMAFGLRYLPDGNLAVGSTRVGVDGAVRLVNPAGMVSPVAMGLGTASYIAAHPDGSIYVSDTSSNVVLRVSRMGATTPVFTMAAAGGADVLPTGIALTPDGSRLYIGSTVQQRIYELPLDAAGMAAGMPRTYAMGLFNANGLAFDQCGNLYVSDRDRRRILRVRAGGGMVEELVPSMPGASFAPWGLAFGRGAGFEAESLYAIDSSSGGVFRVRVGVPGARIPGPGMAGGGAMMGGGSMRMDGAEMRGAMRRGR